jgi:hypothetical protein
MGRGKGWAAGLVVMAAGPVAQACTVCDSRAGQAVRHGIFDGHFAQTAGVVLAPFAIFMMVSWLLYTRLPVPAYREAKEVR